MEYRKTILHVDDDPLITSFVAADLGELGYDVTSLNDPRLIFEQLSTANYRAVLLDIDMPHVDGLEVLRSIKQTCGGCQVIMVTGLVSMETLLRSYRLGAEFCVFKPLVRMEPLRDAVATVFRKIDHWWGALEELSRQRRAAEEALRGLSCPEAPAEPPFSAARIG